MSHLALVFTVAVWIEELTVLLIEFRTDVTVAAMEAAIAAQRGR